MAIHLYEKKSKHLYQSVSKLTALGPKVYDLSSSPLSSPGAILTS